MTTRRVRRQAAVVLMVLMVYAIRGPLEAACVWLGFWIVDDMVDGSGLT